MNYLNICRVREASEELIRRCDKVLSDIQFRACDRPDGSRLTGDLRRQSMELTRLLARMRRER